MKTYFGEITGDYLESVLEGENDSFATPDGKHYDFCLEVGEDGVKITDTIGRYVPLGFDGALGLLKLLKAFKPSLNHMVEHDKVLDFLTNEESFYALPNQSA